MSADNWTPAKGWMILTLHLLVRGLIAVGLQVALLWVLAPLAKHVPEHIAVLAVTFIVLAAVGWPLGALFARKLVETCGLAPTTILVPVASLVIAAAIASYQILGLVRPTGFFLFTVAFALGGWSLIAAGKSILTD